LKPTFNNLSTPGTVEAGDIINLTAMLRQINNPTDGNYKQGHACGKNFCMEYCGMDTK
jgi:hypothetical protein